LLIIQEYSFSINILFPEVVFLNIIEEHYDIVTLENI